MNYPEIEKKINKATGGPHGRMPWFFQFSKNGRANKDKNKKYAKPNKSTMNRICETFDDIGNINMNWAGIPPFNYQMLMSGPCYKTNNDIVDLFCDLDGMSISAEIALAEIPASERSDSGMYEMEAEIITEELTEKFGSVEECYPYIAKALFDPEGVKKPSHKRMFWRVFGDIALKNLLANLDNYYVCKHCGAKVPGWAREHICPKNEQGFFICVDCGKQCFRLNSRQCRCDDCQAKERARTKQRSKQKKKERQKEMSEKCITFLRSRSTPTS